MQTNKLTSSEILKYMLSQFASPHRICLALQMNSFLPLDSSKTGLQPGMNSVSAWRECPPWPLNPFGISQLILDCHRSGNSLLCLIPTHPFLPTIYGALLRSDKSSTSSVTTILPCSESMQTHLIFSTQTSLLGLPVLKWQDQAMTVRSLQFKLITWIMDPTIQYSFSSLSHLQKVLLR